MKEDLRQYEKYLEAATAEADYEESADCKLNLNMSPRQVMSAIEDFIDSYPKANKRKMVNMLHSKLMGHSEIKGK